MKLPQFFEEYFKELMEESEYQAFKGSFDGRRHYGLRVNTLKITPEDFLKFIGKELEPVPWVSTGFYYPEGEAFGKHPAYHAGLYYIQEPSAMMPAQALAPKPGEKVLDLCAAPGGKTTQIGTLMRNTGLLVTNDISPKRVKALVKNIELAGLSNTLVVNEPPRGLLSVYPEFFDRILLDVPCSGEGMFRKDREAVQSYTRFKGGECAVLQRQIFDSAYGMLKPGGTVVYSTCTFNPDENERNIEFFIKNYDLAVDRLEPVGGFESSRSEWTQSREPFLNGGLRLWPHKARGEGHFVCRLIKKGRISGNEMNDKEVNSNETNNKISGGPGRSCEFTSKEAEEAARFFFGFAEENMNIRTSGVYHLRGAGLYRLPAYMKDVPAIRWEKAGLYLGEYRRGRFAPSQSLLMALKPEDFKRTVKFERSDRKIIRYLKSETVFAEGEKGYTAVCMEDYPLGWAKQDSGTLKNLYPKGWRMM